MTKERRVGRALNEGLLAGVLMALALPLPLMALNVPALSQQAPQPTFEQADRNKDGFIDKSEAAIVPGLSATFEKFDTNKDGKLDRDEFARALANPDGKR